MNIDRFDNLSCCQEQHHTVDLKEGRDLKMSDGLMLLNTLCRSDLVPWQYTVHNKLWWLSTDRVWLRYGSRNRLRKSSLHQIDFVGACRRGGDIPITRVRKPLDVHCEMVRSHRDCMKSWNCDTKNSLTRDNEATGSSFAWNIQNRPHVHEETSEC